MHRSRTQLAACTKMDPEDPEDELSCTKKSHVYIYICNQLHYMHCLLSGGHYQSSLEFPNSLAPPAFAFESRWGSFAILCGCVQVSAFAFAFERIIRYPDSTDGRGYKRTHADSNVCNWANAGLNCVLWVDGRCLWTRPDFRRLFKDFQDVL